VEIVLAVLLNAAGLENALTAEERREGWVLLFDGKSSEGWEEVTGKAFPVGSWRIEDGCLRAYAGSAGRQDLRTVRRFKDFELQFEWKLPEDGNSGVKYFVQRVDEWHGKDGRQARGRGFEYQLAPCTSARLSQERSCGSLYGVLAPQGSPVANAGEFNQSRIVVKGGKVEHWLNGRLVAAFEVADPAVDKLVQSFGADVRQLRANGSYIVLQNHGSDTWFRNLKLRQLP
jgi:hypothetical protein